MDPMKYGILLLTVFTLGGCETYKGGQDGPDVKAGGLQISCNATPANQPGCYTPPPSWWTKLPGHFFIRGSGF